MELKHLKLFNESKDKENEFYEEVDPVDFFNENTDRFVDMRKADEMNEILSEVKGIQEVKISTFGYPKQDKKYIKALIRKTNKQDETYNLALEISELDDEWFIVLIIHKMGDSSYRSQLQREDEEDWEECYKCDQWDGVIKLLQDKKILRIEKD